MTRTIPFIYSSFVVPRNQNQIHENNAVERQSPSHYELILYGGVVSLTHGDGAEADIEVQPFYGHLYGLSAGIQ